MASSNKTVKIQGTFSVVDASGVPSPNKTIKDLDLQVSQVASGDPLCIPGGSMDFPFPLGSITLGKRVYLSTDQEVTVKLNNIADIGFPWKGAGFIPSESGITGIWLTTGANDTVVEIIVAGD